MFVHGLTRELLREHAERLPEVRRRAERALLLARAGDVVCVERRPDPAYMADLHLLGLGPDPGRVLEAVPVDGARESLVAALARQPRLLHGLAGLARDAPAVTLNPFRCSAEDLLLARSLRRALGRPVRVPCRDVTIVDRADSKAWVRQWAARLGVPLAEGDVVAVEDGGGASGLGRLRREVERRRRATGRAIVRGARGASGSAVFVFGRDRRRDARTWREIAARRDNRLYVVEVLHDLVTSPNLIVHVPRRGRPALVATSDQRLDRRLAHRGNVHPSRACSLPAMAETVLALARALQARGYGGFVGFDLCERVAARGTRHHFLAEINPRVNAALYPLAALERLRARAAPDVPAPRAAMSGTLSTGARSYRELRRRLGDAFYDTRTGHGALPYATGALEFGRIEMAVLGQTRAEVRRAFAEVTGRL